MKIMMVACAMCLSACATSSPVEGDVVFEDAYTPTGSLIPRKNADRDGKRVILSRENAEKAVQDVQRQGGGLMSH